MSVMRANELNCDLQTQAGELRVFAFPRARGRVH